MLMLMLYQVLIPCSWIPHTLLSCCVYSMLPTTHSVHLRVLDGSSYGPEQQELALESLLEFTREPALMTDLYINYDCDVQCTNLFETICHSLSSHALPRDGMVSLFVFPTYSPTRGRAKEALGKTSDFSTNVPSATVHRLRHHAFRRDGRML